MKHACTLAVLLLTLALPTAHATDAACIAHSTARRTHLVELYTSEGCSSCPPADHWLRGIRAGAAVVPLELHVDYWDALGWRDRFDDHRFTTRQYAMAARDAQRNVYTPEVALDGHEWSSWVRGERPWDQAGPSDLDLELTLVPGRALGARLRVRAHRGSDLGHSRAFFAVTEDGLSSRVGAGENAGRVLRHRYTVRAFAGPLPLHNAAVTLPLPDDLAAGRSAVVAFVQDMRTGNVAQVVRLPLAACMNGAPLPTSSKHGQ